MFKEDDSYIKYFKNRNPIYISDIKFELDNKFYHYGSQFKGNNENFILKHIKLIYIYIRLILQIKSVLKKNIKKNIILNSAYFNLEAELQKLGFNVYNVPWLSSTLSYKLFYTFITYQNCLRLSSLNELLTIRSILRYKKIINQLTLALENKKFKMLILPNDIGFFEKASIRIFRELKKPSYVFLHGLPGIYSKEMNADFLVVWGNQIKKNYINAGLSENKIIVSGHPYYKNYNISDLVIKSNLENILVLTKSMSGAPVSSNPLNENRSMLIVYLLQIQKVLMKLGIKSVFLRPHPSENIKWYYKFIDNNFFKEENNFSISKSLKTKTLVIGPTSTVFIDSLFNGVNYIIYEPNINGVDLLNNLIVPPFDKSDSRAIVAQSEQELEESLNKNLIVDKNILLDYVSPEFSLNFLTKHLNSF